MTTYQIDPRQNGGETFTVTADTYIDAALRAARRIRKSRSQNLTVVRETGEPTLSGMFQAYMPAYRDQGARSSIGYLFHVRET